MAASDDSQALLTALSHKRAALAHWRRVARLWWLTTALLGIVLMASTAIGTALQTWILGGMFVISMIGQSVWHDGGHLGAKLRAKVDDAEAAYQLAVRKEDEAAAAKAAQPEPAEIVPISLIRRTVAEIMCSYLAESPNPLMGRLPGKW
jgi:hypothetical protein